MDLDLRNDEFAMAEPPITQGILDVFRLGWRRRRLVLFGFTLAVLAGGAYYFLWPPVYESQAQVLVIAKAPQHLMGKDAAFAYPDNSVSAHQALIQSPLIISRAIERGDLRDLRSLRRVENPLRAISERLTVTPVSHGLTAERNAVLSLTYRCTVAGDCPKILAAVIESYRDYLSTMHRSDSEKASELFANWRDDIERQLAEKRKAFQKLRNTSSELMANDPSGKPLSWERLGMVEGKRLDQKLRTEQLRKQLAALEEAKKRGIPAQILVELASNWSGGSTASLDMLKQWVALLLEQQELAQTYGPRHPKMVAIQKRIEVMRGQLPAEVRNPDPANLADNYIDAIRQELNVASSMEESLDTLADKERTDAKRVGDRMAEYDELQRDMANLNDLRRELLVQMQSLDLYKQSDVYDANVIAPPTTGEKVAPSAARVGAVAALLGLLLAGTLTCIGEAADRRLQNPMEVQRRLGVSVVGQIPQFQHRALSRARLQVQDQSLDPSLCTFYQANSNDAEAYRSLRTTLYFRNQLYRPQIIQVTSPRHGDGKSTLAANLAVSMAQSGKRVLLIDADFRSSRLHEVFSMQNRTGLASVLGHGPLDDAIQPTSVPNLSVMPTGPLPTGAADLFAMPHFKELLNMLRERFDFVLLDTAPILGISDPCMIAPQVDGVLLTVRAAQDWPTAQRAKQILDSVGANVLGVVINAVRDPVEDFGPFPVAQRAPETVNGHYPAPPRLS